MSVLAPSFLPRPAAVLAGLRRALPEVPAVTTVADDRGAADRLPGDPSGVAVETLALAASVTGLAASVVGRVVRIPVVPTAVTAGVTLVDNHPRLRGAVERTLGRPAADLTLAAAGAVAHGLSGGTAPLAVDVTQRVTAVRAARGRTAAAARASADGFLDPVPDGSESAALPGGSATRAVPGAVGRPVPVPAGPVDRLVDRATSASLAAAGVLGVVTRSPDTAARAVLVSIPKAARVARDVHADALTAALSRRGVVVRRPQQLRLLDRVDCVLVDSDVLAGSRPLVVDAAATADGWTREDVWSAGQRLLWSRTSLPIPPPPGHRRDRLDLVGSPDAAPGSVAEMLLVDAGEAVGTLRVGREPHPLADALLAGALSAGLRTVLTAGAGSEAFAGRADLIVDVGHAAGGIADRPGAASSLAAAVRRLQADGHVVLTVTRDPGGLAAADVGVCPAEPGEPWPAAADLLLTGGLRDVPRLLLATRAARSVSRRGTHLALGGIFLGGLLAAVGTSRRGGATLPGTAAAGSALVTALAAARAVDREPDPAPVPLVPWHALEPDEVRARLDELPARPPVPPEQTARRTPAAAADLLRLVATVRAELADPLTPVLATGAAAAAIIGSPSDAVLVGGVLLANAVISGVQRLRAEQAAAALFARERPVARVVERDRARQVPADALAVGDVIEVRAGDVIPADARLLSEHELEVDEAGLTGESVSVAKQVRATPGAELADRACMVYESTTVLAGTGRAVVVAVGAATEAGRALALARRGRAPAGMQARLEELTRRGLPVTLVGGAAVSALGVLRRVPLRSALGSGVSVAVAAVPEGLPLVATVAQVSAARRLSARGVLVRSARTIEALGRVDTVCFDKTGTLTQGRLRVQRVATLDGEWTPDDPGAAEVLRAAARACPPSDPAHPLAHATDRAIIEAAEPVVGGDPASWRGLSQLPFHSDRGFSASVGRTGEGLRLVVKGAPEVILPRCGDVGGPGTGSTLPLTREQRRRVDDVVQGLAARGLRVLAVARRRLDGDVAVSAGDPAELADSLTLLGFVALADSLRPEAAATVRALQAAGVRPVMITGDHPVTARAIADQLGIDSARIVTGPQLAALDDAERAPAVAGAAVFARVSPEQKLRIVEALQRAGRVVAMTGDGANDAAAIRLADVGIGMTADGSTAARSAADLVLSRPDLSVLPETLVEGRALWHRVRDAVAILLGGNAGEVAFTLAGTALAGRAPLGTRQFLLVNMLTDMLPAMAIAVAATPTDPAAREALLTSPRPSLGGPLLRDIGVRGAATAAGALVAWQVGRFTGTRRRADTMALAALVGTQLGQTLVIGGRNPVVAATALGSAAALVGIIQTPGVSRFFGCRPLGPLAWTTVLAGSGGATLAAVVAPRLVPALRAARPADPAPRPVDEADHPALVPVR